MPQDFKLNVRVEIPEETKTLILRDILDTIRNHPGDPAAKEACRVRCVELMRPYVKVEQC